MRVIERANNKVIRGAIRDKNIFTVHIIVFIYNAFTEQKDKIWDFTISSSHFIGIINGEGIKITDKRKDIKHIK